MDGNGRWAQARGLPRIAGHRAGAEAARRVIEAAPGLGIRILTMYAFSSDNWQRPAEEVTALMDLLRRRMAAETRRCLENGVRMEFIGRRDRLDEALARTMAEAEAATRAGSRLWLRVAIDYSARQSIAGAAQRLAGNGGITRESLAGVLGPEVDLLVRTGGEQRLSDFLLWECAYAELVFSRRMWPDFSPRDLAAAIDEFHGRQRRFGGIPAPAPAARAEAWLE